MLFKLIYWINVLKLIIYVDFKFYVDKYKN